MKQLFLTLLMVISFCVFAQEKPVKRSDLPKSAQTLIKENFKTQKIQSVVLQQTENSAEYQVVLADGTKIKFDASGNWTSIQSQNVPTSLVVEELLLPYTKKFEGENIIELKRENGVTTVTVASGSNIIFDENNNIIRTIRQ